MELGVKGQLKPIMRLHFLATSKTAIEIHIPVDRDLRLTFNSFTLISIIFLTLNLLQSFMNWN